MAVTFTGIGVASAASGAAPTFITTTAALAAGDFVVGLMAYDNSGGGGADPLSAMTLSTGSGQMSGTATATQSGLNDPGTASSGLAVKVVVYAMTTAMASGQTITVSWSGTAVVRAIALMKVSSAAVISYRTSSGATGTNGVAVTTVALTTPSVTSGEGVLCWAGHENGAAITGDADTTNGSWSAVYGTFTGSGVAGMAAYFQSKVVTATATQAFNPTGTSSDWIVGCLIFTETPIPAITQAAYRIYDDGTETGAVALAAQNTAANGDIAAGDGIGQLRVRLQSTNAGILNATDDWQLQWEKNASGSWTDVAVTGSTVTYFNSVAAPAGGSTTNRLGAGTGTFVAGRIAGLGSPAGDIENFNWSSNNYTELLWPLRIVKADVIVGDVIRFRVLYNGLTTGMTYTVVPTINVISTAVDRAATISTNWGGWTATAAGDVAAGSTDWPATITTNWSGEAAVAFVTSFDPGGATPRADYVYEVGMEIQVGASPFTITHLGRWVTPGNSESHLVGIYDLASETPLASVSINASLGTAGTFQYVVLATPYVLAASTSYVIAATHTGTDGWHNVTLPMTFQSGAGVSHLRGKYWDVGFGWRSPVPDGYCYGPLDFKYGGSGGQGWIATATGIVTAPAIPDWPATITSSWGNWTATAVAGVNRSATVTTSWGTWVATTSATVEHSATVTTSWGTWTATSTAVPSHPATITANWGSWTGTAVAIPTHPATITSSWGTWTATAAAGVEHAAALSSNWGTWSAVATGTVTTPSGPPDWPASIATNWGGWTATATAQRLAYATITTSWGQWTAAASAAVQRSGAIASGWGTWTAAATASVARVATVTTSWGTWTASANGSLNRSATVTTSWGTWTGVANGSSLGQVNGSISTNWGTWAATATAGVERLAWPNRYLNAEIGTASSPDPGPPLPSQCVFVFRVLGTTTALGSLCSQYEVDPQRSWLIRRNQTNGAITVNLVPVAGTAASSKSMTTQPPYTLPTTVPEILAVAIDQSVASARMWRINAAGAWVADSTGAAMAPIGPIFDSNTVIRIGSFSASATPWTGAIYWVELRTGLDPTAGSLLWRFDTSEYISGTTFTDARGMVWTLTNANAMVAYPSDWGTWKATATADVEHSASINTTWGGWTATSLASVSHPATSVSDWGTWTSTASALRLGYGTITTTWDRWEATAIGVVFEPGAIEGQWEGQAFDAMMYGSEEVVEWMMVV